MSGAYPGDGMDHYIECSECGHPIERHIEGCDMEGCSCTERWDVPGVSYVRRKAGLAGTWAPGSI